MEDKNKKGEVTGTATIELQIAGSEIGVLLDLLQHGLAPPPVGYQGGAAG